MFDRDKWIEILSSMASNPLRTLLTSISVSVGIFILVVLLGMGKGLETGAGNSMMDDASNSIWVRAGRTSLPYNGFKSNRQIELQESDRLFAENEIVDISDASARMTLWSSDMTYDGQKMNFGLRCVHPSYIGVELLHMVAGRFLNEGDLEKNRKVTIIGSTIRDDLFGDDDPIGKQMTIRGINFMVIGVFDEPNGRWENRQAYIPINTGQRLFGQGKDAFSMYAVKTDYESVERQAAIAKQLEDYTRKSHSIHPDDRKGLRIIDMSERYESFSGVMRGIRYFVGAIGFLTLMIGIIGVSNIMTIVVKERTKEIGVRKALGARPRSIVLMIVQEAVLMTTVSGLVGFLFGVGILNVISDNVDHEFFQNPSVNFRLSLLAIIILVVAGTISGMIPALKAAKIKPVEALKDE
ncbi:MAG: putative ABC transport system permease protein [Patiriisocius sp.]|jgi:putative ABC transport system permease protein